MVRSAAVALLSCSALLAAAGVVPAHSDSHWEKRAKLKKANSVTTPSSVAGKTFDYVIVGGGTAGLTVASRLSENSSVTVAVIEAGADGSTASNDVQFAILAPAQSYFDGIATDGSTWDWGYNTVAQKQMNGRTIYWPRGKLLGGSSAVNGLYMIRHSAVEQDLWAQQIGDDRWSFESVWPYMRKAETWTLPSAENIADSGFVYNTSNHGTDGPVHFGYPGYFYAQSDHWLATLGNLGIDAIDPAGGFNAGAFIATSAIDATQGNWTRSYSKTAYLDAAADRSNLVVLTGYQATKVLFDGTTATGVQFASSKTGTVYNVTASSEVILSAGVVNTPQLLLVSGVGDAATLEGLGIDVVADLPGVGQGLSEHLSAEISFAGTDLVTRAGDEVMVNATYAQEQRELWYAGNNQSLYNSPNDPVAFLNASTLFGANLTSFLTDLRANASASIEASSSNAYLKAGYNATYYQELDTIYPGDVGVIEILSSNTGTYGSFEATSNRTLSIQAGLQHPLSRGAITINSTSTFDAPLINPEYLAHPADIQVLIQAFKYIRTISQTAPYSNFVDKELSPGTGVQTDAEWDTWLRKSLSTEYSPMGSAAMVPYEMGGVVDADCRVYNVSGLRIVDASIVPVELSAHMTAPMYGIAERAAAIIMGETSADSTPDSASATLSSSGPAATSASTKGKSTTSTAAGATSTKSAAANAASTSAVTSGASISVSPAAFTVAALLAALLTLLA